MIMDTVSKIRVSIVEDNVKLRGNLSILIDGAEQFELVSVYDNAEDALVGIPDKSPDVILMDINLPGMSGIECTQRLKTKHPELQIIMNTVYMDTTKIFESLEVGATGYMLKRTPPDQLLKSIEEVYAGGSPMSSQIARKVVQYFQSIQKVAKPDYHLSSRETQILDLLSTGKRDKAIAEELHISVDTVHSHLRRIYEKMQVHSRTEAVVKYLDKSV
jgi:DNA-binding NarL/FixJ family response regulator